jgi:RNA polymerase sigma-70 factor (ECF subfamily)
LSDTCTETDLIAGLRSGDRTAFDSLYTMFSERVWRYVARLVGSDADAVADVVQETFLSVVRSHDQFDPQRGRVAGWIIGIAHNAAMQAWRSRNRVQAGMRDDRILAERNGRLARWFETSEPAEDLLIGKETAALVRECLAALPEDYSRCLVIRYLDELPVSEIAEMEAESPEAVRSRLARARRAFRERFMKLHVDASVPDAREM